jgi:hypothetical protein
MTAIPVSNKIEKTNRRAQPRQMVLPRTDLEAPRLVVRELHVRLARLHELVGLRVLPSEQPAQQEGGHNKFQTPSQLVERLRTCQQLGYRMEWLRALGCVLAGDSGGGAQPRRADVTQHKTNVRAPTRWTTTSDAHLSRMRYTAEDCVGVSRNVCEMWICPRQSNK